MANGWIIPRGKSFRVMVSYTDINGKRKLATKTAPTLPKAEVIKEKLIQEVDAGLFSKPSKIPLSVYMEGWLQNNVKPTLSYKTFELYTNITRKHIVPVLGNVRLINLRPQQIQQFYSGRLQQGKSPRTVQLCHVTLHKALSNAVRTGLITQNPCQFVDVPKVERREMKIMSELDIKHFLDEARKGDYYSLFYLLLFTGCRRGEAIALRWGDVDLIGCQVSINRTAQLIENKITYKTPKTAGSRRQIALTPSTCVVLRLHKEAQENIREHLKLRPLNDDDLIFCQLDGRPLLPNTVTHNWIKLIRKCGLDGVRLHDARHTHATLMLKSGISPKIIQERLGHSTYNITMNLYAHTVPGLQKAAADKFDEIVTESVTNPLPTP